MMWDLDNLKYINDTYGHDYGDEYPQHGNVLKHFIPYNNAIVSRISGDEFYVFLYGYDDEESAMNIIRAIKAKWTPPLPASPKQNKRGCARVRRHRMVSRRRYELFRFD